MKHVISLVNKKSTTILSSMQKGMQYVQTMYPMDLTQ